MSPDRPGAIMDVPDPLVLRARTIDSLLTLFEKDWPDQPRPVGIVLPAFSRRGPLYANDLGLQPMPITYGQRDMYLPELTRICAKQGLQVYLSFDLSAPFLDMDALHVRDIAGDFAAHACIVNAQTRSILKSLINDAMTAVAESTEGTGGKVGGLAGVVFDIVSLWPMGAEGLRIELTCFCRACREALSNYGSDVSRFESYPNGWNLVLRDTGTGIGHIDDIGENTDGESLLARSRLAGFADDLGTRYTSSEVSLLADEVVKYTRARNGATIEALQDILSAARLGTGEKTNVSRVIIAEGAPYSWSSGTFFTSVDDPTVCDELWFDPSGHQMVASSVKFRSYMWRRARYAIDAFFGLANQLQDPHRVAITGLAKFPIDTLRQLLATRSAETIGGRYLGPIALMTLPDHANRIGFVAPMLDEEIASTIVSTVDLTRLSTRAERSK